jgi:lipoprotein signal peptidase
VKPSPRPADASLPHLVRFAGLVAAIDLVSKQLAQRWIGGLDVRSSHFLQFGVVHNDKAAFGLAYGPYTFELNLALTAAAILLVLPVCRDLARIDPLAPSALGLITGGALGNLISLLTSHAGVVDFIAIGAGPGHDLVLNLADVAAYAGLGLMARTGFLILREMRSRTAPMLIQDADTRHSFASSTFMDAEVGRPVYRDDAERPASEPKETIGGDLPRRPLDDALPVRPLSVRQAEQARFREASSMVRPMSYPETRI